jgi:hypothetical protein
LFQDRESCDRDQFEKTRRGLIEKINDVLKKGDRQFWVSFKEGFPAWVEYGYTEFEKFLALQWKLKNILKLKVANPSKHQEEL